MVRSVLPHLRKTQANYLNLLVTGLLRAKDCRLSRIAQALSDFGKLDTVLTRLKRAVRHPALAATANFTALSRAVFSSLKLKKVVLVVDETTLHEHLRVLVVAVAYQQRCIPLAWVVTDDKWAASQVERICSLLDCIKPALPPNSKPMVLADRGIGTSPTLFTALTQRGWRVLLRITDHSKIQPTGSKRWETVRSLAIYKKTRAVSGKVFKQRGQVDACVFLHWDSKHAGPWCLLSNDPTLDPKRYKQRWWIETMFRDWKSNGLEWEKSRLWKPARASVLLLALALALWMLALISAEQPAPKGFLTRLSWFQRAFALLQALSFSLSSQTVPP
jgi:hypothetical protein